MRRTIPALLLLLAAPAGAETIGTCRFDRDTLAFAGSPAEQARCLLRKVKVLGEKEPQALPPVLVRLLESSAGPSAAQAEAALAALPQPYQAYARQYAGLPIARTEAGLPARYFVIHDTSTPFFAERPFPKHLDQDFEVNRFDSYVDTTFGPQPVAHIFLNRQGQIWAGHDFSEPWRATKLESRVIGPAARGRFIHVEVIQPRRFIEGYTDLAHTEGPKPGFSKAQYAMLAALYVQASARARQWLIPAFHANVDDGIPDGHDDPQNFELEKFAQALERLLSVDQPGP